MCGEQEVLPSIRKHGLGSPPRVRGTDVPRQVYIVGDGITPACAGNSPVPSQPPSPHEDHPRVCGEQLPHRHKRRRMAGSPPRVRGTVFAHDHCRNLPGITPACAGNRHPGADIAR